MTILFMATGDLGLTNMWSATGGTVTASTEQARTSERAFKVLITAGQTGYVQATLGGTAATMYTKAGMYLSDAGQDYKIRFFEGATNHVTIRLNTSTGKVAAYRADSTLLGEADAGITTNRWMCIETKVVISDTTGIVEVKVDGISKLALSSQDTQNGGSGYVTVVDWSVYALSGRTFYIDDIVIRSDGWPGVGGVYVLAPNAAGDTSDWTASAGNPYECVDEVPPTFTDYLYTDAATTETVHLLNLAALPGAADSIAGVGVMAYAKLDAAGTGSLRCKLKAGSTTANGADVGLSTSAQWVTAYWAVNPDDSAAWETADIAALQIGVETR